MGAICMSAGVLAAIVLCLVGLAKLPFKTFKAKHPKWFKATFTILSIVLTFGVCLINQAFVLNSNKLFNLEFVVILIFTFAGVFVSYSSYEGLGLKGLVNKLIDSIKNIKATAPESKLAKYIDKVGLDVAFEIINTKKQIEETANKDVVENPTASDIENTSAGVAAENGSNENQVNG